MDLRAMFNECIKDARRQSGTPAGGSRDILGTRKHTGSEFEQECVRIKRSITDLFKFLQENKQPYVNPSRGLIGNSAGLSELDKDQIDVEAQEILKTCLQTLNATKVRFGVVERTIVSDSQLDVHKSCVVHLLQLYLKEVGGLYSQMKSIRLKQAIEKKEIQGVLQKKLGKDGQGGLKGKGAGEGKAFGKGEEYKSTALNQQKAMGYNEMHHVAEHDSGQGQDTFEPDLSPEELQLMEEENKQLFNEMNYMIDEVKQAQTKMEEISKLQQTFVENILVQSEAIERIQDTAIGTAQNIEAGNEQLSKAMKHNVDFRLWVLFFLVMCSFSLLFLDWYS
eukprot:Nk52_evm70s352 gene=Nk52_evmTU70s352